ncbi:MAG: hypothetical protein DRP18_00175 [Candidatus Aenigmatarchaeota archaeon]|nr:MAG: hypothetical protein DRP18_00175 [Candidatus Aenigmarchaeota archaeon]
MLEGMKAKWEFAKAVAEKKVIDFLGDKRGQMDATSIAVTVVILVTVTAIGAYIANEIYTIAAVTSGSSFYTAAQKVPSIMNTSYGLLLILVIAAIAGVIITYLLGAFGGAGGRRGGL